MTTATAQYACARAWVAMAQAHAVVTERLRAELSIRCRLSVNGFETLVRLADGGRDGVRMRDSTGRSGSASPRSAGSSPGWSSSASFGGRATPRTGVASASP